MSNIDLCFSIEKIGHLVQYVYDIRGNIGIIY